MPPTIFRFPLLLAMLLGCGLVVGCGGGTRQALASPERGDSSSLGVRLSPNQSPFRFFAPSSFWNEPLAAGAALDPRSAELVGAFDAQIAAQERARVGPWINTVKYSVPIYTVPAGQATVRVVLDKTPAMPALQSAWSAVPLPSDARPAAGTDGHLVVWQPSMDRLWEFWRLVLKADGWHASWGGAMRHVSSEMGVYGSGVWPGAESWWGASASSLSIAGGLITLEDLARGEIDHALSMAIPGVLAGAFAAPAQRSDGKSSSSLSLPEGAHLRLRAGLDLASLHLPPLTLMIARAAQRYGIFVRDGSRQVTSFYAQDPTPTGSNPYAGPGGYFGGEYPNQVLASFPWSQLQLLKMELHREIRRHHRRHPAAPRRNRSRNRTA